MRTWIACMWMSLAAGPGVGHLAVAADDVKAAEAPSKVAAAGKAEPIKLPPGFKPKKRGKFVVYCRNEAPLGSRIVHETCFDEGQMRDYLIALQETKGNVDRIRSTCSNLCTCGMPDAC